MKKINLLPWVAFVAVFMIGTNASADLTTTLQDSMMPSEPDEGDEAVSEDTDDMFADDDLAEEDQSTTESNDQEDRGLAEDPSKAYFSVGPRIRSIMMPSWFIGMFGVDIETPDNRHLLVSKPGLGAEFTYRKDGFDITAALWWVGLGWDKTAAFKDKNDGDNSWELVKNNLSSLLLTVDFIWSTSFTDWFAITYGAGIGIGIPIGGLERNEAASRDGDYFSPCDGPTATDSDWCGPDEEYDEDYPLPTGIVPWVNFLFGLRFKPHRNIAVYVDAGFGIGFQMGLRGGYIF